MAQQCVKANDPIQEFYKAWDLWLAVDYKPIFATAETALNGCPQDHAFTEAIKETAEAALTLTRDITGLRHDLLGRIFHTVSGHRQIRRILLHVNIGGDNARHPSNQRGDL